MSQRQHTRSVSQGRRTAQLHTRASRPAPLARRGNSYNPTNSHHSHSPSSGSKPDSACSSPNKDEYEDQVDMESFLQYCATCERQIITPGTSILYCSETCRRKDSISRPPQDLPQKHSSPVLAATLSYFDHHNYRTPDIIPQRSPTIVRPMSLNFTDLSISETGSPTNLTRLDRSDSDTSRTSDHSPSFTQWTSPSRPHQPTTRHNSSTVPSLIHSPTSSMGTASYASGRPDLSRKILSSSPRSTERAFSTSSRPASSTSPSMMARETGLQSSASTVTSLFTTEDGAISFEKRPTGQRQESLSGGQSSLKLLFHR